MDAHRRQYLQAWKARHPDYARRAWHRRRAQITAAPVHDLTLAQWYAIKAQYGSRCVYCGRTLARLSQAYLIPMAQGGSHTASNVVPACQRCLRGRGDRPAPVLARVCVDCGGQGPFYGVADRGSPCIRCRRAALRRIRDLARLRALAPQERTRKETLRLLDADCPPGKRICRWCFEPRRASGFLQGPRQRGGWYWYCRTCRAILNKLRNDRRRHRP